MDVGTNNRRCLKFSISIYYILYSSCRILKEVFITLNHKICRVVRFTSSSFTKKKNVTTYHKKETEKKSIQPPFPTYFVSDKNPLENTQLSFYFLPPNTKSWSNLSISLVSSINHTRGPLFIDRLKSSIDLQHFHYHWKQSPVEFFKRSIAQHKTSRVSLIMLWIA